MLARFEKPVSKLPFPSYRLINLINEALGEIEGYIAIWGDPQHRDSYGTWFDRAQPPDMALDFLPFPLMYEHGMSGKMRKEIVGAVRKIWFDEIGIAFKGSLLPASPFFSTIIDDIRKKKLKTSSATSGHIADFDAMGRFVKWYLNELSLTETPAEDRMPIVRLIRSAQCLNGECHITPENYPLELDSRSVGVSEPGKSFTQLNRSIEMGALQQLIQAGGDITPEALLAAAQQDGIDPQALLQILQQMAPPGDGGEMMSAALAGTPVPGAQPSAPMAQAPAPTQAPAPAPMVPGGAATPQEILDALAQLMGARSNPNGGGRGMQVTPQMRSQMTAPPLPQNYQLQVVGGGIPQNPAPQRSRQQQQRAADIQVASRFQHIDADAMALGYMLAEKNKRNRYNDGGAPVSEPYLRAMAYKTARAIEKGDGIANDYAIRAKFPFKTPNEVFESDVSSAVMNWGPNVRAGEIMDGTSGQGAEWIYDVQGTSLWETIRNETPVYQAMRSKGMDEAELPQGFDGELIPLEGSDPTWYVAGGATDIDSSGTPIGTFSTSKFGTGQKSISVAKLSVAMNFQRELEEGSIINIVQEAQRKIRVTAAEQIDYILLNGDTSLTINTNINKIDGTPTAAPALPSYTLLDGIIKLALSSANTRRDCGATFDETDFLATFKKLPTAYRQNRDSLLYISDSDTGIAASNIATVKTRDVFSAATLENGALVKIWKIDMLETGFMYLANASGKISVTAGNNLYGRLLLVVPKLWAARWKRRIQTDVTYFPYADTTQIVAHMRWGLAYRDANAAAITYDIPVDLP